MNILRSLLLVLFTLPMMVSCADANEDSNTASLTKVSGSNTIGKVSYDEGIEYQRITPAVATANSNKIEVVEIFSYACPHCYRLEPGLEVWKKTLAKDVVFVRMPAATNRVWSRYAQIYYTAEALEVLDVMHPAIFKAIHEDKNRLMSDALVAELFAKHGVTNQSFAETFNSFYVKNKVNRAKDMGQRYGANGVPTLVINGKFRTYSSITGGNTRMFKVIDYLIEQERK